MDRNEKQKVAAVLRHAANVLEAEVRGKPSSDVPYKTAEVILAPSDDFDSEFTADVRVSFNLGGQLLAQLLGKQQRVVPKVLSQLKGKSSKLISLLNHSGPAMRVLKKELTPMIRDALQEMAEDDFERGARLIEGEWAERQDYGSTAQVRPDGMILFSVDVETLGKWV